MSAPSPVALAVVGAWPNDRWLTESEVADMDTIEVTVSDHGYMVGSRPLVSVLNEARRRSWLIRDRRQDPPIWKRTPTGQRATTVTKTSFHQVSNPRPFTDVSHSAGAAKESEANADRLHRVSEPGPPRAGGATSDHQHDAGGANPDHEPSTGR